MGAGRPKSIDNTKVFDVAKPGKSKPLSTSRPVIVNHSMGVTDSSVVTGIETASANITSPSASRKVISPITITSPDDEVTQPKTTITILNEPTSEELDIKKEITAPLVTSSDNTKVSSSINNKMVPESIAESDEKLITDTEEINEPIEQDTAANVSDTPDDSNNETTKSAPGETIELEQAADARDKLPPEKEPETPPEAVKKEEPAPESKPFESSETASVDAVVGSSDKPSVDQQAAELEIKRDAALQQLIESKKYVVPLAHDSTKGSGHKNVFYIFLSIFLLAAAVYLALDAKLIKTDIDLPYHFFKSAAVVAPVKAANIAPSITLTQSSLKIPYNNSYWSADTPVITSNGNSVNLTGNDKVKTTSIITATESKAVAASSSETPASTAVNNFQSAEKIPAGGANNIYLATYIRTYTIKDKGTFYAPQMHLSADALGQVTSVTIIGRDHLLSILATVSMTSDSTPLRFKTLAEAQDWFKTSLDFKQIKTVFMGMKY